MYVNILDCYLKRNLVVNGGFLDEVHWMANTKNEQDLKYLDGLVNTTESYKKFSIGELGYTDIWAHANDSNTLYIKIDDDIVSGRLALFVISALIFRSYTSTTMRSRASYRREFAIRRPLTSQRTSLTARSLTGFIIALRLSTPTSQRPSLPMI